jgi:uncharacterized protein YprB with RNaseH-like and TPR domain
MALPPDIFKRLSRLNRQLLHERLTTGDRVDAGKQPGGQPDALPPPSTGGRTGPEADRLETLIPGRERAVAGGRFYAVERRAEEFRPAPAGPDSDDVVDGPELLARYRRVFFGAGVAAAPGDFSEALQTLLRSRPSAVTYLDIETCGLAGEPLFLVGLMRYDGSTLRVDQFLARDYSEERAILEAFWAEVGQADCLVTFNGKTFDVPTIAARSAACGLFRMPEVPAHVDLLHEARRRWKRGLPNCRLQTIEEWVCGRRRPGDIPGGDIPAAYHEFVRASRGDDAVRRARSLRRLQTILHHNALDLVTMAELVTHLLSSRP